MIDVVWLKVAIMVQIIQLDHVKDVDLMVTVVDLQQLALTAQRVIN